MAGPIRCCLGRSRPYETIALVSYAPLRRWARETGARPGPYDEVGPVFIHPEECIDCGACEPDCPVEAIFPEDALPQKWEPFVKINYAYPDSAAIDLLVDQVKPPE